MAGRRLRFQGLRAVQFTMYRSGTSRGVFVLERDMPQAGPDRDSVLCKLMGSGHPQQLEGLGGGCGPTSKVAIVGPHAESGSITYTFAQCNVEEATVDHSHGDCGNMLAAVAPFALESGLVMPVPGEQKTKVRIHSVVTGAVYAADVAVAWDGCEFAGVRYSGDFEVPGIPGVAAPVVLSTFGVAGSQTGSLLPTKNVLDTFNLGADRGDTSVSIVDFARALIMFDANEILPKFGYNSIEEASQERLEADVKLNAALENVRRSASVAMGMGDCTGKDAPKVALLAPPRVPMSNTVSCRYYVNPGRNEMHPTIAMTAAQAIGAACLIPGSIAARALQAPVRNDQNALGDYSFHILHPKGSFPVSIGTTLAHDGGLCDLFPNGVPESAKYTTTVRPVAEGQFFL